MAMFLSGGLEDVRQRHRPQADKKPLYRVGKYPAVTRCLYVIRPRTSVTLPNPASSVLTGQGTGGEKERFVQALKPFTNSFSL